MKKIIYIVLATIIFASCEKEPIVDNGKWDPNAKIYINGRAQTKASDAVKNVVKNATDLSWYNKSISQGPVSRMFAENQRDTTNNRLLMNSTDIIAQYGEYVTSFIEGTDFVIRRLVYPTYPLVWDTIGRIPNSAIVSARNRIKTNYDAQNYPAVYAAFDSLFVFYPCTGEEWRILKAANQQ